MFSRLSVLYGFCTWYEYKLHIWSSQTFWWCWCFAFGSSAEVSALYAKVWAGYLLISVVYVCPHIMLLRGQFVELKIIKHLNYPDWLKMSNAESLTLSESRRLKHCPHLRFFSAIRAGLMLCPSFFLVNKNNQECYRWGNVDVIFLCYCNWT